MSHSRKTTGFSLVELLVVIAIISVLAALLFPVFERTREKARQRVCMNNQRQIGIAAQMYVQDYDDKFFPDPVDKAWSTNLTKYTGSGVYDCPSLSGRGSAIAPEYGFNSRLFGKALGEVNSPQLMIMTADLAPAAQHDNYALTTNNDLDARHRGSVIYSCVDGSAGVLTQNSSGILTVPGVSKVAGDIVFVSTRTGPGKDIYLMARDGSGIKRLTTTSWSDWCPSWNPDGTKISYQSTLAGVGLFDIFCMNRDGTNVTQLTNTPAYSEVSPVWSHDGQKIVYNDNGGSGIGVVNADGSSPVQLTATNDIRASWSPDDARIVFSSQRDGNDEIYIMNADGSNPQRLTNDPGSDSFPAWSPDGTRIAFTSDRSGNTNIYSMNTDGTGVVQLTSGAFNDRNPSWSPDGGSIAFYSNRSGSSHIYIMRADGSVITQITDGAAQDMTYVGSWGSAQDQPRLSW